MLEISLRLANIAGVPTDDLLSASLKIKSTLLDMKLNQGFSAFTTFDAITTATWTQVRVTGEYLLSEAFFSAMEEVDPWDHWAINIDPHNRMTTIFFSEHNDAVLFKLYASKTVG